MKTKKIYLALALVSFVTWSCTTQNDLTSSSLKTSINANAQNLITAVNTISASPGYQLLASQSQASQSGSQGMMMAKQSVAAFDSTYSQILLSDLAGVWDYKAALYMHHDPNLLKFFQKTGTSADMVVKLPESKVKRFWDLLHYAPADTALVNNYVVDVSKYAYHFNHFLGWDYDMASNIAISNVSAGDLAIQSSNSRAKGYHFTSSFAFADGYKASTSYTSGDTIISVYGISKAGATLYEEKYTAIRTSTTSRHREKEYSLTIGNVQIVRSAGKNSLDSAKVFVNGVLQLHSVVKIVTDSTATVANNDESTVTNHNRTIQITFDDGTSTTIKALLGSTIDNIQTLFTTLRQAYFSTNVVDWIAWDIYKNKP